MKLIKRFTSNYDKRESSNLFKLMSIVDFEIDQLKECFLKIEAYRQIEKATGQTLDNIGKNVLQERGGMDDVTYRLYLKTKIKANLSGGQIRTINEILGVILGENYLGVREVWGNPTYSFEPAAFEVRYTSFFDKILAEYEQIENDPWFFDGVYLFDGVRLFDGGLTFDYATFEQKIIDALNQTKDMINFIKAGGVRVYWCEVLGVETLINITNNVTIKQNQLCVTDMRPAQDPTFIEQWHVDNGASFQLGGMYALDGEMLLDGNRPFIAHDVIITEVPA